MRVLRFDSGTQEGQDNYRWIVSAFNASDTRGSTPEQIAKTVAVFDALMAVSRPDDAAEPWTFMDEARALNEGVQEVRVTENQHKWLEQHVKTGFSQFRPHVQHKHYRRCLDLIRDAKDEKTATEAKAEAAERAAGQA